MYVAESHVRSDKAASYLAQLCKHFGHKVPAVFDQTSGHVSFEPGTCRMQVAGDLLSMRCEADNQANLRKVMGVIEVHLKRFAWRETLDMSWTEQETGTSIARES